MNRIYLRAMEPEDYELIHAWRQEDDIMNSIGGNRLFISLERNKKWVAEKSINDSAGIYLAICLKDGGLMIGYCSITNINLRNQHAELGGTIIGDPAHRGKGYGREAQMLMLKYCFEELPLHKVYGYSLAEHAITEKMMISLGFSIDGTIRDDIFKNGGYHSLTIYSILRAEYLERYKNQE